MKISVVTEMELVPFTAPTGVQIKGIVGQRQDGWQTPKEIPLSELCTEVLEQLCAEFVKEVYKRADKKMPSYINIYQVVAEQSNG
ncbi:MAG: hypothetical protein EOM35_02370 [Negativicutes bacterium]|nr:hypothetical protein [Negativicutes bacterium]